MAAECFPTRIQQKKILTEKVHQIKAILREFKVHTTCEAVKCPNIGECFSRPTVTFMILGNICSRNCTFCAVKKGEPKPVDFDEPRNIAKAAQMMGLKHTIITSVCRDDLADGGALHFAHTVFEVKKELPKSTVEVLVPDFRADRKALKTILDFNPHIFNHNIETVPSLYPRVRSRANYEKSLKLIKTAKKIKPQVITKSGFMIGLGESKAEILEVMKDLIAANCDILTIGQYVQPTRDNMPVETFVTPETFSKLRDYGMRMGFLHVESAPYVRSSYNAGFFMTDQPKNAKMRKAENGTIPTYQKAASIRI
ncbi:MAG: lipoyl synthase [bacterium]